MNIELINKTILVTGGAGFIGSNISQSIIERYIQLKGSKHLDEIVP